MSPSRKAGATLVHCNRTLIKDTGNGYGLYLMEHQAYPAPKSRDFELMDDRVQYAPDRPADVRHLKMELALDFEQETVSGTVSTTFSVLYEDLHTLTLDAVELQIERVTIAGKALDYSVEPKHLVIELDRTYHYGEEFTLAIQYHARPRIGFNFIKPAPEDPTRPVQAWSFGQPRYHSHWFPCHDAPNDRATTEVIVTVPAEFFTISNGRLLEVTEHGATKTHHWRHDVPHAAYLVSLVVGDFAVIEDHYKDIPVTYYVRKDRKDDAHFYMGKTPEMMRFFSEFTGVEYPYEKYAQTVVELYTGAMEHTTATTHSFALLTDERAALDFDLVPVVAHELAHQWFGDLVTCRDWSNGWLNEGFATYFEEMWSEHDLGTDYFKQSMLNLKKGYLDEDQQYRRPIVYHVFHDDGFELFDGHMYNKGGWVLHMLRHQLGDQAFKRAVNFYLKRNREREVVTADLERAFEESTGRSLGLFFQQWVYQSGYPEFEVSYSWDHENHMAKVKIKQTQKTDDLTPCFATPVDLSFTLPASNEAAKDKKTTDTVVVNRRVMLGEEGETESVFFFPLEQQPLLVRFDPDGWLLKTLKFERPIQMTRYQLANDPDVLGRIEATEALGKAADSESVAALKDALLHDSFWAVQVAAAEALGTIATGATQEILLEALPTFEPKAGSRARAAIVHALGTFQADQYPELAPRAAEALSALLEKGDISYLVEAGTAESLGKTHVKGSVDTLLKYLDRPSWMYQSQRGIFRGLGASGEDRVVDILVGYLKDQQRHPQLRATAAIGLGVVGENRLRYSEEARQRAVTALITAVEHEPWLRARAIAARVVASFGEKRAIEALERAASRELDSAAQRNMRVSAHKLRTEDKNSDQLSQLRKDLDQVRSENNKLREHLEALEARVK